VAQMAHIGYISSSATFSGTHTPSNDRAPALLVALPPADSRNYSTIDVSTRFGARLRELRKLRNMTQLEMAVEFGIDRSYISDVERGRKSISLPTLEVIALGFNMTLSDLLNEI
jgi:DNA-binding XRE family transcriptional regulator